MTRTILRRIVLAAVLVASAAVPVDLWSARSVGFEQVTVDATAGGVSLTATKYAPAGSPHATKGWCRLRTAEISFSFNRDTTVTASVGTLLEIGDFVNFATEEDLANFRAIRTGGSSGQLDCHYFR